MIRIKNIKNIIIKHLPVEIVFHFAQFFFKVKEVKSKKDKILFRNIWTNIWIEEEYSTSVDILKKIEIHYNRFIPYSTDYLLKFLRVLPIGTMRLIWQNNEIKLPVLSDFKTEKIWKGSVVEITLLTILKKWRGLAHIPSLFLFRKGYRHAKRKKAEIVMAADWRLWKLLSKLFPFEQIGEERFYEGSITVPAYLNFRQSEELYYRINKQIYRLFYI